MPTGARDPDLATATTIALVSPTSVASTDGIPTTEVANATLPFTAGAIDLTGETVRVAIVGPDDEDEIQAIYGPFDAVVGAGVEVADTPFSVDVGREYIELEWNPVGEFADLDGQAANTVGVYVVDFERPVLEGLEIIGLTFYDLVPVVEILSDTTLTIAFPADAVAGQDLVARALLSVAEPAVGAPTGTAPTATGPLLPGDSDIAPELELELNSDDG